MEIVTSLPERTSTIANQKTILSLLIDLKLVDDDLQVYYMDNRSKSPALTGIVTRAGIFCNCCQEEISVWTFEIHAGSDLKKPYEHIFSYKNELGEHTRLKDCLITAWQETTEQKRREMFTFVPKETSASQHDSACSICGYGDDELMCCGKSPSEFHAYCMNMVVTNLILIFCSSKDVFMLVLKQFDADTFGSLHKYFELLEFSWTAEATPWLVMSLLRL